MNRDRLDNAVELIGRGLLGLLFVVEASNKLGAYAGAVRYVTAFGMPAILLPVAIALELGAGAMLIAGWRTRWAALALTAFCVVAALVFHTKFSDRNQVLHFEKDLALAGALLVIWARGSGAWSLDKWFSGVTATLQPK
jgi:putative oxidoreductase